MSRFEVFCAISLWLMTHVAWFLLWRRQVEFVAAALTLYKQAIARPCPRCAGARPAPTKSSAPQLMAFTEADRVQIRKYLGFADLWLQADSRLESAITTSQSISDGGTRPDSSAETEIKATVTTLRSIDAQIEILMTAWGASAVDEVKLDTAREDARLRKNGRAYVGRLARMLDSRPIADCFAMAPSYGPTQGRSPYNG